MTDDQQPKLYPAWRQVLADLLAAGLHDGKVISDDQLRDAFGLDKPETAEEQARYSALFNFQVGQLRVGLLRDQRIDLQRVPGVGYVVVPPAEQTKIAMADGTTEMLRAYERAAERVAYVRVEQLTEDERRANADAAAKLGALGALMRKRLKSPEP